MLDSVWNTENPWIQHDTVLTTTLMHSPPVDVFELDYIVHDEEHLDVMEVRLVAGAHGCLDAWSSACHVDPSVQRRAMTLLHAHN